MGGDGTDVRMGWSPGGRCSAAAARARCKCQERKCSGPINVPAGINVRRAVFRWANVTVRQMFGVVVRVEEIDRTKEMSGSDIWVMSRWPRSKCIWWG